MPEGFESEGSLCPGANVRSTQILHNKGGMWGTAGAMISQVPQDLGRAPGQA